MFVGVVVENFHRCRAEQEKEERARRAAKRAKKIEERRRSKYFSDFYIYALLMLYIRNVGYNHHIISLFIWFMCYNLYNSCCLYVESMM